MKKKISIILLVIIFVLGIYSMKPVSAIKTTLSATSKTVNSGEEFTVNVSSSVALTGWTISASDGECTFVKASGGEPNGKSIFGTSQSGTKSLATYTYKAPSVTKETKYYINFSGREMCDVNTDEVDATSCKATITVKPTTPSGGNSSGGSSNGGASNTQTKATIKKLVVAGKTYNNPSKNITVKVDNDVTNAKISVTTSNGESYTINKGNNVKLEEGTNTVKITLASGNVYTVNIRRAAKEDDTPNIIDEPKEEEKILLKSLKLQGVNVEEEKVELSYTPEFSSEVYEYNVTIPNDITKIDVEAIASKEDYTVEITGNEDLKEGENIITILVKAKNSDKVTTYKIKVIKEKAIEAIATLDETPNTGEEQKGIDNNIVKIVVVIFTALVAIAGIVFAVIEYNYSRKHPKEEMEEMPYSEIGFRDEETNREDILEEPDYYIDEDEDIKEKKTRKKGKHF